MKGMVLQTTGSWYSILCEDGITRDARLKGKFKTSGIRFTNPVAVGDQVVLESAEDHTGTVISEILERKNYIVRQSPRKKFHAHIIAANLDQAVIMASIHQPRTSTGFIDRFIAAAESFHVPVKIIINKTDLLKRKHIETLEEWTDTYNSIGYQTFPLSVTTGKGLDEVRAMLKGKVSLISGHSGVGKSSMINAIAPGLELKVDEISAKYNKGKHTTTYATMYQLDMDTFIVDTPGIKEFGLSQIEPEELSGYFAEMREYAGQCKYNNCLHRDEPGCVVKDAVHEGKIATFRYLNYLQMLDSLEEINYWERDT